MITWHKFATGVQRGNHYGCIAVNNRGEYIFIAPYTIQPIGRQELRELTHFRRH